MSKKLKIFLVGCSYSSIHWGSGWKEENYSNLYPKILESNLGCEFINIAHPGMPNNEIFLRTIEHLTKNQNLYDFCIIQWSSLQRLWMYESGKNLVNPNHIFPFRPEDNHLSSNPFLDDFRKIILTYYQNDYIQLKHWLLNQIALQEFLRNKNIPYIFIKGFDNYISDIENLISKDFPIKAPSLSSSLKKLVCFEDHPDNSIEEFVNDLITLYTSIDKSCCIGYNSSKNTYGLYEDLSDDWADDGKHPGKLANKLLATNIENYIKGY